MNKINKLIIIVLAFLVMAVVSQGYFTNQAQWKGIRRTGETGDAVIPVNEGANDSVNVNITESITLQANITISNYGMKEYTAVIIGNNTNVSSVTFNGLLEHLIIQPNSSTVDWRFKLTDSDGYIIYDGTGIDQTGRLGLIVDLPLIGVINTTIQNVTENADFSIKIVYT